MIYKPILCLLLLLVPDLVFAQEMSPIVVHTGKPVPSTVRTGEIFRVTYRAEFYDNVIIVDSDMEKENVSGVVSPFEVVDLVIANLPDRGDSDTGIIHVRDYTYSFRIIHPEKGDKKLPTFNFIWVEKQAGVLEADAIDLGQKREMTTDEIGIRYVSSPVKPPAMGIRDRISFTMPIWPADTVRRLGYGIVVALAALLFVNVNLWLRSSKYRNNIVREKDMAKTGISGSVSELVISASYARRELVNGLNLLLKDESVITPSVEMEKKVHKLLLSYLLVMFRDLPVNLTSANTPTEMIKELESVGSNKIGAMFKGLSQLSAVLVNLDDDIELNANTRFANQVYGINSIIKIANSAPFRGRIYRFFAFVFGRF